MAKNKDKLIFMNPDACSTKTAYKAKNQKSKTVSFETLDTLCSFFMCPLDCVKHLSMKSDLYSEPKPKKIVYSLVKKISSLLTLLQ